MPKAAYGAQRISIELTNTCNLHCSYCLRDEDALYHSPANFFSLDLLRRIATEAREACGVTHLSFTGGEPTLHPKFREILDAVAEEGLTTSFVTNGWHFERLWPTLQAHRANISHVSFSLDGATREAHDRWRGEGSFVRLVRAFSRCRMGELPFAIKVGIRRDTATQLETIALFAARMGARALMFSHLLPTGAGIEHQLALTLEEQATANREIAELARIFQMHVSLDVGYYNVDVEQPPCSPLAGTSCNIDYRGRLSLCCNLSGFRGATEAADVVADLNDEGFASAYEKLRRMAEVQLERRKHALADYNMRGEQVDLYLGSPCLFCLQSFGKIPWRNSERVALDQRVLPVVRASGAVR